MTYVVVLQSLLLQYVAHHALDRQYDSQDEEGRERAANLKKARRLRLAELLESTKPIKSTLEPTHLSRDDDNDGDDDGLLNYELLYLSRSRCMTEPADGDADSASTAAGAPPPAAAGSTSYFSTKALQTLLLNNLQIFVDYVHIRYEDTTTDPAVCQSKIQSMIQSMIQSTQ